MTPNVPHMTPQQFRAAGHELIDWIADYLASLEHTPVTADTPPNSLYHAIPKTAPEHPEQWPAIWKDFQTHVLPRITHWQSPNFHAFFPCNSSPPAILGELLSAGLGINGFLWQCSPAITELEMAVMDALAQLIDLPQPFRFGNDPPTSQGGGVIHGTASEAVLTAIVAARHRAANHHDTNTNESFTCYASTQAHSSIVKAAMVSGIGRHNVRLIPTDDRLALRPELIRDQIQRDLDAGCTPTFICATLGTTSTGAFDPLHDIAAVRDHFAPRTRAPIWIHADAAYAGAAMVCPEHRHISKGVEHADSFNFNPHKWLLTNFDCSAFWVRQRAALIDALAVTPAYLANKATASGKVIDYRDWQIPLGRRFRALKLWFVLRSYGSEGLRAYIREHIRLAELFESLVREDPRFELPTPRSLSLVCFRLRAGDEPTRALAERVNATRQTWLTTSLVPIGKDGTDRVVIRMAIGATTTREHHVRNAWNLIASAASQP